MRRGASEVEIMTLQEVTESHRHDLSDFRFIA